MQIPGWWFRLRAWFRKDRSEREMDDELRFHLEMQAEEYIRGGMSRTEARRAARRSFGGVEQVKENCRDIRGIRRLDELVQDLRYGLRMLRKNRGFTLAAVITLALGIGANSAIFSVVYAQLIQPLPYRDPESLVAVSSSLKSRGWAAPLSAGEYFDLKEQSSALAETAASHRGRFVLTGGREPREIEGASVTSNLFSMLGVTPILGRTFFAEEDGRQDGGAVLISRGLWQEVFGGSPDAIGKRLVLDDVPHTIVGVLPPQFAFPARNLQVWLPLVLGANRDRNSKAFGCVARLRPDATLEQAREEADAIARRADSSPDAWSFDLTALQEKGNEVVRTPLLVIFGAVGFILLIACANVANLQLARAGRRNTEMAVRSALGASRGRLLRQQLTENLLLGLLGGGAALVVAAWTLRVLAALKPPELNRLQDVALNGPALIFTLAAGLITGLLVGVLPAFRAARLRLVELLREGAKSATGSKGRRSAQNLLVVTEIALAVMLLIGAGLMVRSFARLLDVDEGFDAANVVTLVLHLPESRYSDEGRKADFYLELLRRMRALPGVTAAGGTTTLPTTGSIWTIVESGEPVGPNEPKRLLPLDSITSGYFRTMGIPLLRGRTFTEEDRAGSPPVVIVNETLARRLGAEGDPLGKPLKLNVDPAPVLVGVVADSKQFGLDIETRPHLYTPFRQWPSGDLKLVIRTTSEPSRIIPALKAQVWALDRRVPVTQTVMMADIVSKSTSQRRFHMILMTGFSALALLLAAVGTFGVVSYTVSRRRHEIGVRRALGADCGEIVGMILGQSMRLAAAGLVLGLAGAFALTRLMEGMLFGVGATDPVTFAAVSLLTAAVALLAAWIPARRAAAVDAITSLRCE